MQDFIVFEKVPDTYVGGGYQPPHAIGSQVPNMTNLVTGVRAKNAMDAIKAVMSATGRIGTYAAVPCEWVNFRPDARITSEDGILTMAGPFALEEKNGDDDITDDDVADATEPRRRGGTPGGEW